jgi:hypothetical protein
LLEKSSSQGFLFTFEKKKHELQVPTPLPDLALYFKVEVNKFSLSRVEFGTEVLWPLSLAGSSGPGLRDEISGSIGKELLTKTS